VPGGTLSHSAAGLLDGVALSLAASRRALWRGQAQEESALLEVALPSSATVRRGRR
jgi:hypothetical protein